MDVTTRYGGVSGANGQGESRGAFFKKHNSEIRMVGTEC